MKKYLFFDFDGTLTKGYGIIPDNTKKTIEKLKENGHFICIATGRMISDIVEITKELKVNHYIADGGYSYMENNDLKYIDSLDIDNVKLLLKDLEENKIPWAINDENAMILRLKKAYENMLDFPKQFKIEYLDEIDIEKLIQMYKIHIKIDNITLSKLDMRGFDYLHYYKDGILIEPTEKEKGIRKLLQEKNIKDEDVIVFGDGYNDISMFSDNWYSVAMGNAVDSLKKIADFVTKDSGDDGITFACERLGLL